jgi:DNA-binding SARP family transcriptional activator/tetratricopeptide (TPR) repeat protein
VDFEVRAFGALAVGRGSTVVPVGTRSRQVLLAMLVANLGSVVPVTALAECLWPGRPPADPANRLRVQVHRLRRLLGSPDAIQYHQPGYALVIPPDRVDVCRFEELVRRGRAARGRGDQAGGADLLGQALALYRGPAFPGLDDVEALAVAAHRLAELRLGALEDRITAGLAVGEDTALIAELSALVSEHPLRERFRCQLMTALHRAGRRADALAAYRQGRQILVEELGVEPSQECQELVRAILADRPAVPRPAGPAGPAPDQPAGPAGPAPDQPAGPAPDRPAVPVPRQLPADPPDFTGRDAALRLLDSVLTSGGEPGPVRTAVLDGLAGAGKTALAVHWAHRVADRFPDGQLFADLRGYSAGPPVPPIQVLAEFLTDLGEPAGQVPAELDRAAARYRSLLAGRRVLVVLDNAADPGQVRPLLPGSGTCAVLVTSRDRLAGLIARDGARRVVLEPLDPAESRALLTRLLDPRRVRAEPGAMATLAQLCGHLPLALRIAAADLTSHPQRRIGDWVWRLRATGWLAGLALPADPTASVTAAFDLSYHRLPEPARRLFRLQGLAPGPDLTVEAAAALVATPPDRAAELLDALARAHLLEEPTTGRYRCHDLVRQYATQRALAEEAEPHRAAALAGLYAFYLGATEAAVGMLFPGGRIPPAPGTRADPRWPDRPFADQAAALAWLQAERANLTATVRHTAPAGPQRVAWQLADRLRRVLPHCGHVAEALVVAEAGLAAARRDDHPYALPTAELAVANAYFQQARYWRAAAHASRGWRLLRHTDWLAGQGSARHILGVIYTNVGRDDRAQEHFLAALERYETVGWRHGQANVVSSLALLSFRQGQLSQASGYARRAEQVFVALGSTLGHAAALVDLGNICCVRGELGPALDYFTRARARYRAAGWAETEALLGLAQVHGSAGRLEQARQLAEAAAASAEQAGDQRSAPECLATVAEIYHRLGDSRATDHYLRALALGRANGAPGSEIIALVGLAAVAPEPGGYPLARERATRALELTRSSGLRVLEGRALTCLAGIELVGGDPVHAISHGEAALVQHRAVGHPLGEGRTHLVLGRARAAAGDQPAARDHWRQAYRLLTAVGAGGEAEHAATLLATAGRRPDLADPGKR